MEALIGLGDATYTLLRGLMRALSSQSRTTLIGLLILALLTGVVASAFTASLSKARLTMGILPGILAGVVAGAVTLLGLAIGLVLVDQWVGAQVAGIPLLRELHRFLTL
jgi:hypothetical protein